MDSLQFLGKCLKEFIPLNYNIVNNTSTPITPKPNYYYWQEKPEQAFFIYETTEINSTNIQKNSRKQILYKHKEVKAGFGFIEAKKVMVDLVNFLHSKNIITDDVLVPVGVKDNYFVYSLNFTMKDNK